MGILCLCQQRSNMFKSLLATALVVAVKAEADPFYGYYGALPYAHGYAYAGVPFGSSTGLDPITQGLDPVTQGALPVAHYYGKRSADADAAVAAAVPFGDPSGLDPITQGLDVSTQGYLPYAHGFYGHHLGYYGHYYGGGLLMPRLTPTTLVAMLLLGFPLDTLLAWTPSPRALMPPPRVTIPMPTATSATTDTILATSATTTVKFRELTRHVC